MRITVRIQSTVEYILDLGGDPIKTYKIILQGLEQVPFPSYINKNAQNLIKKLCKDDPDERLGTHRQGILEIKKHRFVKIYWFNLK